MRKLLIPRNGKLEKNCKKAELRYTAGTRRNSYIPQLWVVALDRKSYLFADSGAGGERAAAIYNLIGTAKLDEIDPESFLRDVFTCIAVLLHWSIDSADPTELAAAEWLLPAPQADVTSTPANVRKTAFNFRQTRSKFSRSISSSATSG